MVFIKQVACFSTRFAFPSTNVSSTLRAASCRRNANKFMNAGAPGGTMRSILFVALLSITALAGCSSDTPPATTTTQAPVAQLPEGVLLHGRNLDPAAALGLTPAAYLVGEQAFEPTIGVDAAGNIFFATADGADGVAVGFGPDIYRSQDGGVNWTAVGPRLPTGQSIPPETNDPFIYVDSATGRVFQFAMSPILVCAPLSWSDDQGATWTTNPKGCGNNPPWDHQSMVAAAPRVAATVGYENVLHQCVNQVAGASCSRSLNGGLTWEPGVPVYTVADYDVDFLSCSGSSVHGHPKSGPDGTVYLPSSLCGHIAALGVTRDDGLTWDLVTVSDIVPANVDPVVAVDANGTVYYAFLDNNETVQLAFSKDFGATWSAVVAATPPGLTANIPAMAAGADGRIVLAYPGTLDVANDVKDDELEWAAYFTVSVDANSPNATFTTIRATPADDPIVRGPCGPGRCTGMVDFISVVVGPDGRPYASFVDACTGECATDGQDAGDNNDSAGLLVTLKEGLLGPMFAYPAKA